jgi:hypothetical protein
MSLRDDPEYVRGHAGPTCDLILALEPSSDAHEPGMADKEQRQRLGH